VAIPEHGIGPLKLQFTPAYWKRHKDERRLKTQRVDDVVAAQRSR